MAEKPLPDLIKEKHFVLLLLATLTFFQIFIIRYFIVTLIMALFMSAIFHPFKKIALNKLNLSNTIATALTLFLMLLMVFIPFIFLIIIFIGQGITLSKNIQPWIEKAISTPDSIEISLLSWLEKFDLFNTYKADLYATLFKSTGQLSEYLGKHVFNITSGGLELVFLLFVGIYAFCCFLSDTTPFYKRVSKYFPLSDKNGKLFYERAIKMGKVILKSILIIGMAQGILIGGTLALLGIQGSAIWGLIIVLLSPIPGIGAGLIWFPTFIYLLATGNTTQAIILFCIGLIVSVGDNFIRPQIIGNEINVSRLLLLVSLLGGGAVYGLAGIFIGPLVLILFLTTLELQQNIKNPS